MLAQSLGWEDPPGGENGNPLQCSCLNNSMDRGAWQVAVHGVTKRQTQLSMHTQLTVTYFNLEIKDLR